MQRIELKDMIAISTRMQVYSPNVTKVTMMSRTLKWKGYDERSTDLLIFRVRKNERMRNQAATKSTFDQSEHGITIPVKPTNIPFVRRNTASPWGHRLDGEIDRTTLAVVKDELS